MTKKANKPNGTAKDLAKLYEPTAEDRAAAEIFVARDKNVPPLGRMRISQDEEGVTQIALEASDKTFGELQWMNAFATTDLAFLNGILKQLINAGTVGREPNESDVNFMASVIRGINPQDQLETMLAAQMASVHMSMMTFARRLAHVENIPQQDAAERAFNKLARTFATQMQALKRYRTGGEQKVIVEYVNVEAGGQAIVGNVATGGGPKKTEATS